MANMLQKIKQSMGIESSQQQWHEFHPTSLVIERQPTSPLGRIVFWTMLVLMIILVGIMYFGQVDVTVSASGQVLPASNVQVIQPLETGVLKAINVKEGQAVKQGDILFEVEPDLTDSILHSTSGQQASYELEVCRLEALLGGYNFSAACSGECPPEVISQQRVLYSNTLTAHQSRLSSYDAQANSLQQRQQTVKLRNDQAKQKLSLINAELGRLRPVADLIASNQINSLEQQQVEQQGLVDQTGSEYSEISYQLQQALLQKTEYANGYRNQLSQQLIEARRQLMGIEANQQQTEYRKEKQFLRAPADGVVSQLKVNTVGQVITPSEILAQMVDKDNDMQLKLLIPNRDIGLLKIDQDVKIKVDAYDYQKYGMMKGKLRHVNNNIRTQERADAAENNKAEPFTAYVTLEKETIVVDGVERKLSPGMSVRGEVMVGKRRLHEFFLYPLLKAGREAFSLT
jgi:hemolysin D